MFQFSSLPAEGMFSSTHFKSSSSFVALLLFGFGEELRAPRILTP
jgi:hypothetical protein